MAEMREATPQKIALVESNPPPIKPEVKTTPQRAIDYLMRNGRITVLGLALLTACDKAEKAADKTPTVTIPNTPVAQETISGLPTATSESTQIAEATTSPEAMTHKQIEVYADPSIPKGVKNRITDKTLEEAIAGIKSVTDQLPNLGGNRKIKIVPGQGSHVDPEDPTQALIGIDWSPQIQIFFAVHDYDHIVTTIHYEGDITATAATIADRLKYMTQEQIDHEDKLIEDALTSPDGRQYPILSRMFTKDKSIAPLVGTVNYSREQLLDWKGQYANNIWLQTGTENYTGFTQGKNIENTSDASYNVPETYGILVPETFKKIDEIAKAADTTKIQPYNNLSEFLAANEQLINNQIINNPQIPAEERAITQKSFELLKAQQNLFTWENISQYPDLLGKYDAGWKSALKSYLQLAFEEKYMENDPNVISLIPKDKTGVYAKAVKNKLSMADTEELAQFHATVVVFKIPGTALDPYINYQKTISTGQIIKLQ